MTETLLIATDGSTPSLAAVDVGLRLARERGARVTFVHSSPDVAGELFERNPLTAPGSDEVAAADPVLAAARDLASTAGVEAELRVLGEHGARDVAAAIVGAARGVGATLVVVGARGRGAIAETVVGSVSRSVMEASHVPVVVVHAHDGATPA